MSADPVKERGGNVAIDKRKKKGGGDDEAGTMLAGLVACGVIAGEADGEVNEEEIEAVCEIVVAFAQGYGVEASEDEIRQLAMELAQKVSDAGAESFLPRLAELLGDDESRRLGCLIAAAVIASDEDEDDEESEMYYAIADALGFSDEEADEIWNEAIEDDEDEDEEGE